jgi:hypothetical protein
MYKHYSLGFIIFNLIMCRVIDLKKIFFVWFAKHCICKTVLTAFKKNKYFLL